MDKEKDDLKSIKVYKLNKTKESWHEIVLKFRFIADSRGPDGIIDGSDSPPDEKEAIVINTVSENITENVAKDTSKGSWFGCFEYVPYTALSIV